MSKIGMAKSHPDRECPYFRAWMSACGLGNDSMLSRKEQTSLFGHFQRWMLGAPGRQQARPGTWPMAKGAMRPGMAEQEGAGRPNLRARRLPSPHSAKATDEATTNANRIIKLRPGMPRGLKTWGMAFFHDGSSSPTGGIRDARPGRHAEALKGDGLPLGIPTHRISGILPVQRL